MSEAKGTLALVGGGEFTDESVPLDRALVEIASTDAVVVLPTAAAYEQPDAVIERASAHFAPLGLRTEACPVLRRGDAESAELAAMVRDAAFVYIADGSPLHLRSVLKDSALFAAIESAWRAGAVIAASGAGATLLCDPMVDPRGGAYTVGLGLVAGLAVFPYHGSTADHLLQRSIDLLPRTAVLAGVDEATALVRDPDGTWHAEGAGEVHIYTREGMRERAAGDALPSLAGR